MGKFKSAGIVMMFFWGVTACDNSEAIKNWIENTNQLQIKVRAQSEIVPYRQEQHRALKEYFTELVNVALAMKNDPTFAEQFNSVAAKADLNEICRKVLINRASEWASMMQRCTRNAYFLCAEEVRAYPDIIAAIREKLLPEQQKRFDEATSCKASL
jgi:hypothetical protein